MPHTFSPNVMDFVVNQPPLQAFQLNVLINQDNPVYKSAHILNIIIPQHCFKKLRNSLMASKKWTTEEKKTSKKRVFRQLENGTG